MFLRKSVAVVAAGMLLGDCALLYRILRDSIQSRSRRHSAGGGQQSTGLLHLDWFESRAANTYTQKDTTLLVVSFLVETTGLEPVTSCV